MIQATHQKAGVTELTIIFHGHAIGDRHIVDDPMMFVVEAHSFFQNLQTLITIGIANFVLSNTFLLGGWMDGEN